MVDGESWGLIRPKFFGLMILDSFNKDILTCNINYIYIIIILYLHILYIIYFILCILYYIYILVCIHHAQVAAEARKFVKDAALEEMISVIEGDSREAMLWTCENFSGTVCDVFLWCP